MWISTIYSHPSKYQQCCEMLPMKLFHYNVGFSSDSHQMLHDNFRLACYLRMALRSQYFNGTCFLCEIIWTRGNIGMAFEQTNAMECSTYCNHVKCEHFSVAYTNGIALRILKAYINILTIISVAVVND